MTQRDAWYFYKFSRPILNIGRMLKLGKRENVHQNHGCCSDAQGEKEANQDSESQAASSESGNMLELVGRP